LLYALIVVAAATVDRLLHRATVVSIDGESYRRRAHGAHLNQLREASSPGTP
jgi:DNA replication protein DnaC